MASTGPAHHLKGKRVAGFLSPVDAANAMKKRRNPGANRQPDSLAQKDKLQEVQQKLGRRVRGLRRRKGLTSLQLARDCALSTGKLERIESGEVNITVFVAIRLARRLGVSLAEFFRGVR